MTLEIKDAYEQSLKGNSRARRNPNAAAGTNATVRYMRSTVDMKQFTAGVGKILHNFGKGVMIGEEEINGIEGIIESNPDVTVIDNITGYAIRIRSDTDGDAEHFKPSDTQRLLKKTNGHGYKRFAMKTQKSTQRLNMKVLLVMFIESVYSILKPSRDEMGRLLHSVYKKSKRMNDRINSMEKTEGSKHITAYINNTEHGRHMVDAMYTHATGKEIMTEKVGDSHLAILVEELKMVGAVDE